MLRGSVPLDASRKFSWPLATCTFYTASYRFRAPHNPLRINNSLEFRKVLCLQLQCYYKGYNLARVGMVGTHEARPGVEVGLGRSSVTVGLPPYWFTEMVTEWEARQAS